jgi:predicted RNase H-like nuclease
VVVTVGPAGPVLDVEVVTHVAPLVDRVRRGRLAVVAIDMPFGLAASGRRACDDEARRRLGPRRATVFPTPPRPLLGAATHAEAVRRGRALDGRGISVQAYNLLPRIAELDAALGPADAAAVVEAHPESGFAAMAGAPLTTSKRSPEGRRERVDLLVAHLADNAAVLTSRTRGAAVDDLLDAGANAWTARRWWAGTAEVLGDGSRDERGLPMRIVV